MGEELEEALVAESKLVRVADGMEVQEDEQEDESEEDEEEEEEDESEHEDKVRLSVPGDNEQWRDVARKSPFFDV